MAKISVRHSVAQAYGLLFGRPLSVIGLTWLPAVFYAVAADFLIHRMDAAMATAVPSANGLFGQYAFFYFVALVVATAFFGAVIAVPLTRQAFGLREEQVAVHLVVGGREFRLFFAFLRYYAIAVTTLVVLAVGAGVAITQGTPYAAAHGVPAVWQGYPLETWANSIAGAVTVIIFSVIAVRYGFFLDAIAAVEDHARLRRAASLSRGNFWAIATTLFIAAMPACLLLLACEMTFGGLRLSTLGLAAAETTPFAGILAAGLVVLHALLAGASAGAYAEMAEQMAQEGEPYEPVHAPAAVYAQAPAAFVAPAETTYQAEVPHMAAPEIPPMEIATPEADAVQAATAPAPDWMPPPPDAHFGSDPHDAQHHDMNLHHELPTEALAAAVAAAEAHPVEAQNAPVESPTETPVVAETAAESIAAEHGAAEPTPPAESGAEAQPAASEAATQVVGFDGHPTELPEHAHNAEFPPPPLDPAGVLSAQAGFHSPPPG
ncbi:MAG TPA: hypothetical protein VMD53_04110 [Rhizomicrobium sp.]|nr:hypothetical protein [Rhizomicrobium sp.]